MVSLLAVSCFSAQECGHHPVVGCEVACWGPPLSGRSGQSSCLIEQKDAPPQATQEAPWTSKQRKDTMIRGDKLKGTNSGAKFTAFLRCSLIFAGSCRFLDVAEFWNAQFVAQKSTCRRPPEQNAGNHKISRKSVLFPLSFVPFLFLCY